MFIYYTFTSEAVVGLERTIYSASEHAGVVEVCAIVYSPTIDCPIAFPFSVSLSTTDGSAGKHCDVLLVGPGYTTEQIELKL